MKYLPCQLPIQFAGEIHGTLHRKVLENYQTELAPGAGLILKHVGVILPVKCLYSFLFSHTKKMYAEQARCNNSYDNADDLAISSCKKLKLLD